MSKLVYPVVRRSSATYMLHKRVIADPYDYLEDPASEETKEFVQKQNDLFRSYMQSSTELRDKIAARVTNVMDYSRTGAPSLRNGQYYYFHNSGLQNQDVLMRTDRLRDARSDSAEAGDASESVFLDVNALNREGTTALKATAWSEDEKLFAYSVSDKGSDWQRIRVRDVATANDLPDELEWAKFTCISWWHNAGFFYTRYPALEPNVDKGAETDTARDAFVCYHTVGTPQSEDVVVLRVPEHPLWSISASVTDCHSYLVVSLFDGCEPYNLIWIAPLPASPADLASESALSFTKLVNEFAGQYSYLGNDGSVFYFTSTKGAPRSKIVSMDVNTGTETEMVAERDSVLSNARLVRNTLLLVYMEDVKDVLYVYPLPRKTADAATGGGEGADRRVGAMTKLDLPIGTIGSLHGVRHRSFVSLKITSFLMPGRTFVLDISDPVGTLRRYSDDTVNGFDAEAFVTEQRFYESDDGTRIPMFIVYKKGTLSASSPVLLYGYGGFNIALTPYFSATRLVFHQHLNGVLAIANIRGGGEYGEAWHDAGRRETKQNCFTDFIAAARFLHANQIGSPQTTAIMGGSNGGLLVGAVANQAPSIMSCVICQVGVLDVFKFHKFTIGHAWTSDFGNPDNEEDFHVIEKYSPLHNIRAGVTYPAILVLTGDHDDRVVPLHSLKYVATLQHTNPNRGGPFLARVEVAAGHGAGKPTSKIIQETADTYAFIAKHVNASWND